MKINQLDETFFHLEKIY